jgi:short chain dehydrogenase
MAGQRRPKTTAEEVLVGCHVLRKTAIMTGGHAGLGLETTRVLSNSGATVVIGSRDPKKAQTVVAQMKNVEVDQLDLASPNSIDRFANAFLNSNRPLDRLINNRWGPAPSRGSSREGGFRQPASVSSRSPSGLIRLLHAFSTPIWYLKQARPRYRASSTTLGDAISPICLFGSFDWRALGLSSSHRLQGESHA